MNDSPTKNFWSQLSNSALVRFLLLFACGWAIVQILAYFESVIVIFTFATVIAFLLSYPVQWLRRFLPHGVAVCLVFFLSLIFLSGITFTVGLTIVSQAQQLIDSITNFLNSVTPLVQNVENYLRSRNIAINLLTIQESLRNQALAGIVSSIAIVQTFFSNFLSIIFIAVVAFFMLLDGERLWSLLLKLVPYDFRKRFSVVTKRKFLGFFRGQLILSLFHFGACFVVFLVLEVPYALLLSFISGFLIIIPGIGATLGVIITVLIVLCQDVGLAFKVLVASIIIEQIQDNLIAPRIMRNTLNLNPVVVFFALLVGARVAGLLGIFIAIPLAGVLVSLFEIEEMKGEA